MMDTGSFQANAELAPPVPTAERDRWEYFKPAILGFYIDESKGLAEVVKEMKEKYKFDALSVSPDFMQWINTLLAG